MHRIREQVSFYNTYNVYLEISARDYVNMGIRGKSEFGITNYHLPKGTFDLARTTRIHPGKRTTYIDEAVKLKKIVPAPTRYNVNLNMGEDKKKSGMGKGMRRLMTDDIANF